MNTRLAPSLAEVALKRRKRSRIFVMCVFICAFLLFILLFCANQSIAYAASDAQENIAEDLADSVDGAIDRLDSDLFQDFVDSLGGDQAAAVGRILEIAGYSGVETIRDAAGLDRVVSACWMR